MTTELLVMDVTLPCGKTTTYGLYPADQIKAYCERVRVEHQLSQTTRVLRPPTEDELAKLDLQDSIFRVKHLD